MEGVVCAVDAGTSLIKAGLLDQAGKPRLVLTAPAPASPATDLFSIDPAAYARALFELLAALDRDGKHGPVRALGLAGQRATVLALDAADNVLAALAWHDTRCDEILPGLTERLGAERFHRSTGLPLLNLLSIGKIAWLRSRHREVFDATARFASLHDYLLRRLGAEDYFTEFSLAACLGFLDRQSRNWDPELLTALGLTAGQLPRLVPAGTPVGAVSGEAGRAAGLPAGLTLVTGGGDQEVACLGLGVCAPGDAGICLGTSATVSFVTPDPQPDYHAGSIVIPHVVNGQWIREGFQISFASSLQWCERLLGAPAFAETGGATGPDAPLFVPFHAAGGPGELAHRTGIFAGLAPRDGPRELADSVSEGVGLELRHVLEQMGDCDIRRVVVAGGPTAVPGLLERLAAALGRVIYVSPQREATLLGAAALAWAGNGAANDPTAVVRAGNESEPVRRIEPPDDPARPERYRLYRRWRGALHGIQADWRPGNGSRPATAESAGDDTRQQLMDFAGIGLFRYAFDGTILKMDRGTLKILELDHLYPDPEMVVGKNIGDLFHYVNRREVIRDRTRSAGRLIMQEYPFTTLGGRKKWSLHDTYLVFDEASGREAIQVMARDITALKQAESELRENRERLLQADKLAAIGQLAGGIAHDFNNQLTGISGYAELLARRLTDQRAKHYIEGILTATQRASDLTQQLLAFGRKGKYLSVPLDIHQILTEVVKVLERSLDKNIELRRDFRAAPSLTMGDPTQLQSALLNLALNARDAMPNGGELSFATSLARLEPEEFRYSPFNVAAGDYLRISLTDTGCGMNEEVKQHLFEPFFTTKPQGQGTGLGLASVLGAMRNHQGAVRISSREDRGTTVALFLPLAPATAEPGPEPEREPARPGTGRIMLVDDEPIVRSLVSDMLQELGYAIISFKDGQAAVEFFRRHGPDIDLVILDMIMPGLSGVETLRELKEINPRLQVLLSSGYSPSEEVQGALEAGEVEFIPKPYRQADLAAKVEELVEKSRVRG